MSNAGRHYGIKSKLAGPLLAGFFVLLPVFNAHAVASLTLSTSFDPAGSARDADPYMDSGGVWNQDTLSEVTNTTGDGFSLTVQNTAAGPVIDDTAYDVNITVDVPAGFRLPTATFSVTVTELSGGAGCSSISPVDATQPGGVGTPVNLNIPAANSDIPPGCEYQFDLGLTTTDVAPFVNDGTYAVSYDVVYNEEDGNAATQQTESSNQNVEVRTGDVALQKTAVTTLAGDGDNVEFTVSLINGGQGGIFEIDVAEILGPDFDPASLNMTTVPAEGSELGVFVNPVYSIPYIGPGAGVIDIQVTVNVQVDPNAASCPILNNTASVTERTGGTNSGADAIAFDLQEPLLTFTAPVINVPLNGGPTAVSVDVINSGSGTAKQVSMVASGATDLDNFNVTVTSPGWVFDSPTDTFTFAGTITSGATETLTFTVETTSCPPPAGGNLDWDLGYQNVCGTVFNPAVQSANLNVTNVPNATITKSVSAAALNVGDPGSYTLATGGANLAALPANDGDNANNNDFTVSDTFPAGIQNISIPAIPAGTEVEVLGVGVFTGSVPAGQIPDGGSIEWRGDAVDLQATPNMQVDFLGGDSATCPTGQTITNNATLTSNCAINDTDGAGFILNENPAGGATFNITVGGDGQFETGAPDTNNIDRDEAREGEHIPFNVSYTFPAGYLGGGVPWTDLAFNADLRTSIGAGEPLVLTNNRNSVLLTVTVGGAPTTCTQTPLIPGPGPGTHFSGGDGAAPLNIADFGFVQPLCGIVGNVDDVTLLLEYSATSAEGTLAGPDPYTDDPTDQANVGTYIENTTLSIASAPASCTGPIPDFIQGITVDLIRSDLDMNGSIGAGGIAVCEVVPVTVDLNELNPDTTADNLLFNLGLTDLQIVDGADAPSVDVDADITRAGGFAGFTLTSPPGNNTGPVDYELQPNTTDLTGNGTLSFNARVLDVAAALNATVSFDSKHSSPDAGGDADRDFSFPLNITPANIRSADLDLEFFPNQLILRDQTNYTFRAHIVNTGDGDAVGGTFQITLPPEMNYVSSSSIPAGVVGVPAGQTITWDLSTSPLGDLGTGEAIDIDISVQITQNSCFQGGPADEINSQTDWGCGVPDVEALLDTPPIVLPDSRVTLTHLNNSFCELCDVGEIHLLVRNTGGVLVTDVEVTEDMLASGLEYVPNSTTCVADEGTCTVIDEPTISGTQITWTSEDIQIDELGAGVFDLYSSFSTAPNTPQEVEIIFQVRRPIGDEEALASVARDIRATGKFGLFCDQFSASPSRFDAEQEDFVLPIRQPVPQVVKQGRNVDAAQSSTQYTDTVFGGRGDRVIWRINVRNIGNADLEDLLLNDLITPTSPVPPNMNFLAVCPSELIDADALSRPFAMPAGCVVPDNLQSTVEDIAAPFGAGGVNGEDVNANSNEFVYILGQIQGFCTNMGNNADVSWGCDGEDGAPPYDTAGGLLSPATPIPPGFDLDDGDPENLSTRVDPAGVTLISHTVTGVDGGAELGYRGRVTFTIRNASGGTIKNLVLTDTLPAGYAIDPTQFVLDGASYYLPTTINTAFGNNYEGMVQRALWLNRDPTFENNTAPDLQLVSNPAVPPGDSSATSTDRVNIIRHNDEITITFDIVRVQDFDVQADPDVATENAGNCTDPQFPVGFSPAVPTPSPCVGNEPPLNNFSNDIQINFSDSCDSALLPPAPSTVSGLTVDPEDLDIDINPADPSKVYILSNPNDTQDLTVRVTNNGGHDAENHFIYVTIGSGLWLPPSGNPPAGCTDEGPPPGLRELWLPALPTGPSPPAATMYRCATGATFTPGAVRDFLFTVQKVDPPPAGGFDLTFRADVVGEVTLNDASALTFPTPDTSVITNVANNYSLDSIRARIIGFNLFKSLADCREQTITAGTQTAEVQIGEDCTYNINAQWFGFASPGFGDVEIKNLIITDTIGAGQGYISEAITKSGPAAADVVGDTFTSDAAAAPDQVTTAEWRFNFGATEIISDDFTIDADLVTRTRNDALDASGGPNDHSLFTDDIVDVTFDVDFDGFGSGAPAITFSSAGFPLSYPPVTDRRVRTTIAEPNLATPDFKQVCNETINPDCDPSSPTYDPSLFADAASGDVNDSYIYRIRIANAQSAGGTTSKPAFDVVVNDVLDLFSEVVGPAFVGIDNDSDNIIDVFNPTVPVIGGTAPTGAPPRTLTFDSTTTPVLAQIDENVTVDLFYRVDADNSAIPGQVLTNNVTIDYDSLAGASGNQDAPQLPTSDPGGARAYQITDSATVNLLVPSTNNDSKAIINTSFFDLGHTASLCPPDAGNTYCTGLPLATNPQRVSIGEEVRFQFEVGLPAATYNNLTITDELPPGLDCTGVDDISLDPSSFSPSTSPVWPADFTCDADTFEVRFGTREVTALPTATLTVTFVARVENLDSLREATNTTITNVSGGGRVVELTYEDSGGNPQSIPVGPAVLTIAEPDVVLDKTFSVASADASDRVTVTVTADNDGSAPAFNLRILDDLTVPGINLSYVSGSTGGANPPDVVDEASPNNPIFIWNTPLAPDGQPGESITFTFEVDVAAAVQPLEVLENTIQAAWTSLPDSAATVALSTDPGSLFSSGAGADGTGTGMRIGAIPNAGDPLNNYEASFLQNNLAVPAVTMVKTDITPALTENQSIGARRDFEIVISLPEGVTNDLVITDNLAQAGLSYILEDNATVGEITYTYSGIDTIDGDTVVNGSPTTDDTIFRRLVPLPANGDSGLITWDIGTVVTDTEQDPGTTNPSITINYRARINNGPVPPPTMNAGDNLANSATMTYTSGLAPPTTENVIRGTGPITVLEPEILPANVIKIAENITPGKALTDLPDGGDIIRYTVTIPNTGDSPAFDLNIVDTIPPELSLLLGPGINPTITIGAGVPFDLVPGQTPVAGGTELNWGRNNNQHDLDIPEGESLVLTYQVRLQDIVEPNQAINNSVWIDWTSQDTLPPDDPDERNGAGCPVTTAPNTYCVGPVTALLNVADDNAITKTRTDDTFVTGDSDVRVGDILEYTLTVNIQEGITNNIQLVDTLPEGLDFIEVISVNGDSTAADGYAQGGVFTYTTIPATNIVEAGDPRAGPTTVTWSLGNITNVANIDNTGDDFVIVYRALVLDQEFAQAAAATPVVNSVDLTYDTATVPSLRNDTETINLLHPVLSVTKTAPLIPDNVLDANDVVRYQVDISNTGLSPAYDTVLRDIIPVGMRNGALTVTTFRIELLSGAVLPNFAPVYDSATGITTWDFDSGIDDQYTIPPGDTLRIVYDTQVDSDAGAGLLLNNQAQVQLYYSFDDEGVPVGGSATPVREIYGPSNVSTVNLITPGANPIDKDVNPLVTQVAIGQPFTYRITIPDSGSTLPIALHDVRIFDDMSALGPAAPGVEVGLVSISRVSGTQPWNPVNTAGPDANGRFTSLVIEDSTGNGIDIPPDEYIEIDVTVVVTDNLTPPVENNDGDLFVNTADYSFNQVDDDPTTVIAMGGAGTSPQIEVIEPDLTLEKRGLEPQPVAVQFGAPIPYTLVADNVGTSAAHDITLVDNLPDTPSNLPPSTLTGGTCDTPPTIIEARIVDAAENPLRVLAPGTDYTATHLPAPTCELRITMITPNAAVQPTEKLMVDYTTTLDVNSQEGALLDNTASIFEYFSQDTAGAGATGEIRRYPFAPVTDTHQVVVDAPVLSISKSVENITTGQAPSFPVPSSADPDHILQYTIRVTNLSDAPISSFDITDEIDRLAPAGGYFKPNSLNIITNIPGLPGTPTDFSSAVGGVNGTGLIDIRGLSIDAAGGPNDSFDIVFQIELQSIISSGTIVSNQAEVDVPGFQILLSHDPYDDVDDPLDYTDDDPTETIIGAVQVIDVDKTSQDLTGDPDVLVRGDTLRYTIETTNIGSDDLSSTTLRDQIPANTTYVANSTTLNGVPLSDPSPGVSRIESGMLINAPGNTTPGVMQTGTPSNTATVTFDVVVNNDVINGTVISNQAFVSGTSVDGSPSPEFASDDPDTDLIGDPTQDVVGNLPILDVQKTAILFNDVSVTSPGQIDTNDILEYTIVISNTGPVAATGVVLQDNVPVNANNYIANSTFMNGELVPDGAGNTLPLITGLDVSSDDLTPPLPGAASGTISARQTATVTFRVEVTGADGQQVINQADVTSNELPLEPSDADGNDENGDQQTIITIGSDQQLQITKEVLVVGGGVARAGGQLEYIIRARNTGNVPVADIVITDDLAPLAGTASYVPGSARLNNNALGTSFAGNIITADYGGTYGTIDPGEFVTLTFRVAIDSDADAGDPITNTAVISWNAGTQNDSDSASIDVGGAPGVAILNGTVWHDPDYDNNLDTNERLLENWDVDIVLNGILLDTVQTDADGVFRMVGLAPSAVAGSEYELRFRAPGAGANTAALGTTDSAYNDSWQQISDINVSAGENALALNLPIDPNGVVYDAILRTPVAGTTLTLLNASNGNLVVPASCFDDPAQQNQVTLADGYYKFSLNFSAPGVCNAGDNYVIQIQPPAAGYVGTTSVIIPPARTLAEPPFDVPSCPGSADDLLTTAPIDFCEIQDSEFAPATSVAPRTAGTTYYLQLTVDNGSPAESQWFNNHIPVDPQLDAAISISKTSALLNVTRSQLVPYTITLNNTLNAPIQDLDVIDNFPAGFKYIAGSARVEGVPTEPLINGLTLTWPNLAVNTQQTLTIKMLLVVGSGVGEGEYINRASVINNRTGGAASGEATATVRVVPDPTFDCSDVIGKVFDDKNLNGYQDEGEPGLSGVRVATATGLLATTDEHGRFHITCAVVPNEDRGSNFIMKLDDRSLPSGYRLTTENPRVQRATRGKMLKFNFGTAIHRVVRLDMADAVFEPGTTDIRPQWISRISLLLEKLREKPSVLRLSYLADLEDEDLVEDRLETVKDQISERWQDLDCCYKLMIETEIFWRRGAPVDDEEQKP